MIDRGQPIPLFGDGSSNRDYTYIDDTIQGVVEALAYDCSYEIFNLGRSEPIRLIDLGNLCTSLRPALYLNKLEA